MRKKTNNSISKTEIIDEEGKDERLEQNNHMCFEEV
jgi:uncharacterized protein YnzC (UPF0291/DUF896 family)